MAVTPQVAPATSAPPEDAVSNMKDRRSLPNPQIIDTSVAPHGFASPVTGSEIDQAFRRIDEATDGVLHIVEELVVPICTAAAANVILNGVLRP